MKMLLVAYKLLRNILATCFQNIVKVKDMQETNCKEIFKISSMLCTVNRPISDVLEINTVAKSKRL